MAGKPAMKLWNRNFIRVFAANTLTSFSFYLTATILAQYLTDSGLSISEAGLIIGLFSVTSLVLRPGSGVLADKYNKLHLMRLAAIFMTVGLLGYMLSYNMIFLVGARVIHGIGFALSSTASVALASEYIPGDKMGEGIGYVGISNVISSAVAPGIGISLASAIGTKYTFFVASAMAFLCFVFMLYVPYENREQSRDGKVLTFKDIFAGEAVGYTVVAGIFSFFNGIISSYLVLFAQLKGIANVSLYFTVCAVVLFFIRPFSGRIMDKKGFCLVVIPGVVLTGISTFLLGSAASMSAIIFTGIIRSIGQGAAQPSLQAACIKNAGKERSGIAISTFLLGGDIGQGIGPMAGGWMIENWGYDCLFNFCGCLFAAGLMLFLLIRFRHKRAGIL